MKKKQTNKVRGELTSTYSAIVHRFMASLTHAPTDGHHPFAISITVEFDGYINFLSIGDAHSPRCNQRSTLSPGKSFLKNGTIPDDPWAFTVENADGNEWHAATIILEGQVETVTWNRPEAAYLCVDLHYATSQVHLWEAFVSSDGVHLDPWVLHPRREQFSSGVAIWFIVVQVEGLLAGAWYPGDAAAVPHWEFHLHMDALSSSPVDVLGANPVVLVGIKDIAHLVGANSVHVLVVSAHLFPLQEKLGGMFLQRSYIIVYPCTLYL